jgi:DNA-binding NarL/FixJ family response regulator
MNVRGFAVTTAATAEEAFELLSRVSVDVAVVDIRLPGMDGQAFILRAHQLCPDLRFVIYTGSLDYEISPELRSLGLGERHVLHKPLRDMGVLAEAVRDAERRE